MVKPDVKIILSNPALTGPVLAGIATFALAAALTSQYVFGLKPCILCVFQRIPYAVIIALGGLIYGLGRRNALKPAAFLIFLSSLTFLGGAVIAFYHSGVELHWWTSFLEGCKANFDTGGGAKTLLERIESEAAARCDEIPWADPVLHLSMANWNAIISGMLAVIAFIASVLTARRANGVL